MVETGPRERFASEVALSLLTETEQNYWLEGAKLFNSVYVSSCTDYYGAINITEECFPGFKDVDDKLETTTLWLLNSGEG